MPPKKTKAAQFLDQTSPVTSRVDPDEGGRDVDQPDDDLFEEHPSTLQGQFDRLVNSMNQMMAREIGIMRKEAKDQFRSLEARLTVLESRETGATVGDDPRQADKLQDFSQATVLNARTLFNDDRHVLLGQSTFPIPQGGVDVGASRNLGSRV